MTTNRYTNGSSPPSATPLNITIAGAGIGGLCAAIGLRQQGHNVTIFEQSRMAQETGAAIHVAPNCNGLLKRLGLDTRKHGSVELLGLTEYLPSGVMKFSLDLRPSNKMWQHSWELIHRAHLHSALKEIALAPDGKGKPAELRLSTAVRRVDPVNAEITLVDGTTHRADLILGADGVHSKTRQAIPNGDLLPFDSGKTAFRFLIPTAQIEADPMASPILQHHGHLITWPGEDRRIVMYPCVGGTQMNFVAIFPSEESSLASGDAAWQQSGNKEKMLSIFSSFGENVLALLKLVDGAGLKTWTLLDMNEMPSFVHGKFAVLGDAAHPFLPYQAQGGAQAIEDAMSLAALLPLGTLPDEIPERLDIYQNQRYERSHYVQEGTRISGADLKEGKHLDNQSFFAYNVGHDEWDSSTGALSKYLSKKHPEIRRRMPVGFGPTPGPRQPLGLSTRDSQIQQLRSQTAENSSTFSIRFRSSRTYLQNLLPPDFSFIGPATVCEASISCTTLDGMTWLGGAGYNFVTLALHNTQYTQRDGNRKVGSFIVLMVEDLADPIVTGRDELGMPKLFSDIEISKEGVDGAVVRVSWRGTTYITMSLHGLDDTPITSGAEPLSEPPPGPLRSEETGLFAWRYVPAVGQPGKADVEYPVFLPFPNADSHQQAPVQVARTADIVFEAGSWQKLPTLHNVARVLAEIPNYGVVEAKHFTGTKVHDFSGAYRIE